MVEKIIPLKGAQCSHGGICILRFSIGVPNCTFPLLLRINRISDLLLKIRFVVENQEIIVMERAI